MSFILLFRVCLILIFVLAVWRLGDWQNWRKYYPTVLFVMVINLGVSFITYHHILWNYSPDILIKTQSTVELVNSFIMLPAAVFTYLSRYPINNKFHQYGYILLWVVIFSGLEYVDTTLGGITYKNGWSWHMSSIFDIAMFSIIRMHHINPLRAWTITLVLTVVILVVFNFDSAEMK